MKLAVIGLGKLGLPLAALLASKGHSVAGFDKSANLRKLLREGRFRSTEPSLNELIHFSRKNLWFADSINEAIHDVEVVFVIVPTPSLNSGYFSNLHVNEVISEIGKSIEPSQRIVINIVSTVMPGSCSGEILFNLERSANRSVGADLGLCYNPEFVALGSVIENMRFPDMHLLGESHSWAGQKVQVLLQSMTEKEVPIMRMKLVEAELVKIAINNFVTMKISFANALLQCASKIGNINIDVVTDAMGLDSRIGSSYLRGSVPYGGPCFPRDTRALAALMGNLGVENSLAIATERLNASHLEFILQQIVSSLTPKSTIGVVGLSYKLGSPVTEESPGISLIQKLLSLGYRVYGYDDEQAVTPTLESDWNFHECRKIEELMSLVDFVVITREIKDVDLFREYLKKYSKNYLNLWRYL